MTVNAEINNELSYSYSHRSPVRWILSHTRRMIGFVILAVIGALGNAMMASAIPFFFGIAFADISADQPRTDRLLWLALGIAGSQFARVFLQYLRGASFEYIGQTIEFRIREELYVSLLKKSMTFHHLQPLGDTMARSTDDVRQVNLMFNPGINLVVGSFAFLIQPIVMGYYYHPSLILTPVLFVLCYIVAIYKNRIERQI